MKTVIKLILSILIILAMCAGGAALFRGIDSNIGSGSSHTSTGSTSNNKPSSSGGSSSGNTPSTPSGGGSGNTPSTPTPDIPIVVDPSKYPVGTVLLNGKELSDNSKNITFKSGDTITVCGISEYDVYVNAYLEEGKPDFSILRSDIPNIYKWSDYKVSCDPYWSVKENNFLYLENSGLTFNKISNGFSLIYKDFAGILGVDIDVLAVDEGVNAAELCNADKFHCCITADNYTFDFCFNIVDDWEKLFNISSTST